MTITHAPRDGDVWHMPPLTWRGLKMTDGRRSALVCCANGHAASPEDHVIAADGIVNPSLVCGVEGCGWHVFVRLEGWTP